MPNDTVRANAQAMPTQRPLSLESLSLTMLDAVDDLSKASRLLTAAGNLACDLNLDELDPMLTVLEFAEEHLKAVRERLDAARPKGGCHDH